MIQDLCRKLKEKRRQVGWDLEEVVEKTKLHPSVIRSIESGDLENINPIYLKGYIKIYASFLGIPVGDELDEISPKKEKKAPKYKESVKVSVPRQPLDFSKIFTPQTKKNIVLVGSFVIGCIIVVFLFSSFARFVKKQIAESREERVEETTLPRDTSGEAVLKGSEDVEEIIASLKVRRDCFVRTKLDGKLVFEGVLRKGVVESWRAGNEIEFKISDGSSVDLEVNGKLYPPLSKIRKPIKSLRITPEGIFTDK